jgi:hypothetical protein
MTRPTLLEDVNTVVETMRTSGQEVARAKYAELVMLRKLAAWEEQVFRSKCQEAMTDAGLWSPPNAKHARNLKAVVELADALAEQRGAGPMPEGQTVVTNQSPVKEQT